MEIPVKFENYKDTLQVKGKYLLESNSSGDVPDIKEVEILQFSEGKIKFKSLLNGDVFWMETLGNFERNLLVRRNGHPFRFCECLNELELKPSNLQSYKYKKADIVIYKGIRCFVCSKAYKNGIPVYDITDLNSLLTGQVDDYFDVPETELQLAKPSEAGKATAEDLSKAIAYTIEKHPKKCLAAALFMIGIAVLIQENER